MRPAHSPHTRLRQLAGLLANHSGRFTLLLESDHPAATAADTQALLELRKIYCTHTRCLDCLIGQTLLAPAVTPQGTPPNLSENQLWRIRHN
jgi:hypothetical protein